MKTKTLSNMKKGLLALAILIAPLSHQLNAQTFIPSAAVENIYPPGMPTGDVPTCYSFQNLNFGGTPYDAYLSAVNGMVAWQLAVPGSPGAMVFQGTVPYPGCVDINVGMNFDNSGNILAIVAYYRMGVGHFYDVYIWTTGGLIPLSTTPLSSIPFYTRISMDSHKMYGIVITWEDPAGIYCVAGLNGVFTAPIYLVGSSSMLRPDVAFSHSNVGLNVHFVYDTPNAMPGYDIYETEADFWLLYAALGSYTPAVMDINPVLCFWSEMTASIDAPDHYPVDNWAYTYAVDGADIYTRTMDFYSMLSPITVNVVNGSLGNGPMVAKELRPRIAYNKWGQTYHVCWYSSYVSLPIGQCYFVEEIFQNGTTLISAPDYELMAINSSFPPGASLNSVAFSKQNDASPFLYGVFLDAMGIHDTFHNWANTSSYKGSPDVAVNTIRDNCSSHQHATPTGITSLARSGNEMSIGPNPFTNSTHLFIPPSQKDEQTSAFVTDITGKILYQKEDHSENLPAFIEESTKKLSSGTYFVSIKTQGGTQKNFKLLKAGNNN
jgi:hypothetical protein